MRVFGGVVARRPIYEKDRLDPLDPSVRLELHRELLLYFPDTSRLQHDCEPKGGKS